MKAFSKELKNAVKALDTVVYDVKIESDKWRNIWFRKDGRSAMGIKIHHSKLAAHMSAINAVNKSAKTTNTLMDITGNIFPLSDHSHVIQIPWKE